MITNLVAKQYKLQQWARMIQDCKSSGLTVSTWCEQNRITKANYYYRFRRVREAMLLSECTRDIVAIPAPLVEQSPVEEEAQVTNGELRVSIDDTIIHVNADTPAALLKMALEVVHHVR